MTGPAHSPGLAASLRRLVAGALELVELRLGLLANELELEKLRLIEALAWLVAALVAATIGALLLALFVVLLAGETWRLHALGLMALLFIGGAVLAWRRALGRVHGDERLFSATRAELARDRAALSALGEDDADAAPSPPSPNPPPR